MRYILTRRSKDGTFKDCRCSLDILKNNFTVYFEEITPEIGLNDGNFHSVEKLTGIITDFYLTEGVCLEGCFVNINGKWHKDGFLFKFAP